MRKDGKIGTNGLSSSNGSSCAPSYYGSGMKRVSRPKSHRRAYLSGSRARKIGTVLVFVAAVAIVSAFALAPAGSALKSDMKQGPPPPPFFVQGLTYDSVGTMLFECNITITNLRTGAFNYTNSTDMWGYAYYEFNLNDMDGGWVDGDIIRVEALHAGTGLMGQNESPIVASMGYLYMDITLDTEIPEFSMVIIPVVGMMALVVAVRLKRRRAE